ncbi:hypothetical protein [Streptomyces chryseus]|uniref:Uncharacterized protein n=1 Tax=Streptomyces chryseus TaxID=68186 RepID=A0ABQ3DVY0_9ACTN|nr:hypothetical protein [Streptomyces chryseus]GHB17994.1 hypothetical protein GCM10010346_47410 [Streptomyces chryseus]
MTQCPKGAHELPYEDDTRGHCDEHGVTLLWHGPPITLEDFTPEPHGRRFPPPAPRALGRHPH